MLHVVPARPHSSPRSNCCCCCCFRHDCHYAPASAASGFGFVPWSDDEHHSHFLFRQETMRTSGCSKRETSALQSTTGPNHSMIRMVYAILGNRKNHFDRILDLHGGVMFAKSVFGPYLILEKFVLHYMCPTWQLFSFEYGVHNWIAAVRRPLMEDKARNSPFYRRYDPYCGQKRSGKNDVIEYAVSV